MPAPTGPLPPGAERGLTNEPHYQGEPILAVAAVDELTAADAIERIRISGSCCRSCAIRSTACVPTGRTRARKAMSGIPRRLLLLVPDEARPGARRRRAAGDLAGKHARGDRPRR